MDSPPVSARSVRPFRLASLGVLLACSSLWSPNVLATEKTAREVDRVGNPDRYDVQWDSPSHDSAGSVPLGNGDIGVNAWVDLQGDLRFYIAKTDAWGDNGRLLKVGGVRVHLDPPAWQPGRPFLQTLSLRQGTLLIEAGEGQQRVALRLWVDANRPVIQVDVESASDRTATASIELWRTESETLASIETSDVMLDRSRPTNMHGPTVVEPDKILPPGTHRIGWYHHNVKSVGPGMTARVQGLLDFERIDTWPGHSLRLIVGNDTLHVKDCLQPEQWHHVVGNVIRDKHAGRLEIWLDGERIAEQSIAAGSDAFAVSQGYALQRYITACAGRGVYPIKFNGSLFTVPYPGRPGSDLGNLVGPHEPDAGSSRPARSHGKAAPAS